MRIGDDVIVRSLFGDRHQIAMEAPGAPEDLTATTNDMMKRASGGRADPGGLDPARTSEETQAENAEGTDRDAMSDNVDSIDPEPNEGGDPEMPPDEGGGDDLGGMDDFGDEGGDMGGMDNAGGEEQAPTETPEQARNILKLQKNMSTFYQIITNMVDILSTYSAPASTPELRKIFNSAVDHLSSAKEMMYDLVASEITPNNYPDKLRKYIALRHVYSVALEMLQLHFHILDDQSGLSNK